MSINFPNLGLKLEYVPKSFRVFGFEITLYGILIAVGMLLALAFIVLEAKRKNEDQNLYLDALIIALICAVAGARLLYVGFSWNLYKDDPMQIFNLRNGGMAFYGGLLGGCIGAAVFCRIKKLSFGGMADIISVGILIGQTVGLWGSFFNRESFGEYTDSWFAMQLPLSAVRTGEVTAQMRENLVNVNGTSMIQVHPAFFYESLWCFLLLMILLMWRRKKRFQGEVFMVYLAGYGLGKFFIEWLRTDRLTIPGTSAGISQSISAVLFCLFAATASVRRTMVKKRAELKKRRRDTYSEPAPTADEEKTEEPDLAVSEEKTEVPQQDKDD